MATVKDLINRFGKQATVNNGNSTIGVGFTPADFERKKRELEQREAEQIRAAKERAKTYNATMRDKLLANAQKQQRLSDLSKEGSDRSVIKEETIRIYSAEKNPENEIVKPVERNGDTVMEVAPLGVFVHVGEATSSNPLFDMSRWKSGGKHHHTEPTNTTTPTDNVVTTPTAIIDTSTVERDKSLDELSESATKSPGKKKSTKLNTPPPGGFREIHMAVKTNRPSVSDLLLEPMEGERSDSISSVGPRVLFVEELESRLDASVSVRTILEAFYQTYAPEKIPDIDLVLDHFVGRTEALLFTLECKYFVRIDRFGIITPVSPFDVAQDPNEVEDERLAARRASIMSAGTDFTDLTTDSYKGYSPSTSRNGGNATLQSFGGSAIIPTKHNSGQATNQIPPPDTRIPLDSSGRKVTGGRKNKVGE